MRYYSHIFFYDRWFSIQYTQAVAYTTYFELAWLQRLCFNNFYIALSTIFFNPSNNQSRMSSLPNKVSKNFIGLFFFAPTFSFRFVSFPLLPRGQVTVKYRSTAMATRVTDEAAAPTHATFPPVRNLHNHVPTVPSGWVKALFKIWFGATNAANVISEMARFTSR